MKQTKIESAIEVFFNYASGFLVAYLAYAFIVMPTPWLKDSAFLVTVLFTGISIIRTYLWRRFFNAGIHKIIHSKLFT